MEFSTSRNTRSTQRSTRSPPRRQSNSTEWPDWKKNGMLVAFSLITTGSTLTTIRGSHHRQTSSPGEEEPAAAGTWAAAAGTPGDS